MAKNKKDGGKAAGVVSRTVGSFNDWNKGGSGFGGKDLKTLQRDGYSSNQIMKIAAAVGSQTRVSNGVNNKLKAGLEQPSPQSLSDAYFQNTKDPFMQGLGRQQGSLNSKNYTWGGVDAKGKPLALSGMDYSGDPFGKGKAMTWTVPGSLKIQPKTAESAAPVADSSATPSGSTDSVTAGSSVTATPTTKDEPDNMFAVSGGTGSSVDGTATSFRRKKSAARSSGLTSRGTGQFRNSLKVGSASGINIG
jgi:hypothetical protein